MKRTFLISVLVLVALVSMVIWMVERTSRTQEKGNSKASDAIKGQWTVISAIIGDNLRDFQFLDENHGWAITTNSIWKTDDGGQTWTEVRKAPTVKLLKYYEPQETLEKVQFLSQTEGWVVEGNHLVHTTDGGASWQKHEFKNVIVRSFRFLNRENGWFVGQLMRLPLRKGEVEIWHPVIYGTKNGGRNWQPLFIGSDEHYPLWDVWPISPTKIWAVGFSILHSEDGGATWNRVHIKDWKGVSGMPIEIQFLDSNVGWMKTSEGGGYLFTSDGGKNWEPRPVLIVPGGLANVVYVNPIEVWGVAGNIYHSSDGGKSWVEVLEGDYFRIQYLRDQKILFAVGKSIAKCVLPQ
jgi:photosystem II stability/assembly factor-like uncharacterized protein